MTSWDDYPPHYRQKEIEPIAKAARAGESAAVIGLSGSGKSNLLGFLASRVILPGVDFELVDCNRLHQSDSDALFRLARAVLGDRQPAEVEFLALEAAVEAHLNETGCGLCLLIDRFEVLQSGGGLPLTGNLRALRDAFKYRLSYLIATRRPFDPHSELAELFYANTLWLSPLAESDARWSAAHYAGRKGLEWDPATIDALVQASWGYPSFLRAVCEAHAAGAGLSQEELRAHPAVQKRVTEFLADRPGLEELERSGLAGHPFLKDQSAEPGKPQSFDPAELTAKEHLLWEHFRTHPGRVCDKDELIRAVWPEDQIYTSGLRDDSLAQLVRRLRVKIEPEPSEPRYIHTVTGRGYRYTPD